MWQIFLNDALDIHPIMHHLPGFVLQAGKFNIVPTIIALGSGIALLGAVSNVPIMLMSEDNLCYK